MKHHFHLSGLYISPYCKTCNLKLKYKKGSNSDLTEEMKKKAVKRKQTKFFDGKLKQFIKRAEDIAITIYASLTVYNFSPPPSTRWSKVWLQMGKINLAIPLVIIQSLIWFLQRRITHLQTWTEETNCY